MKPQERAVAQAASRLDKACNRDLPLPLDVMAACYLKAGAAYYWRFIFRGLWRQPKPLRALVFQMWLLKFRIASGLRRGI